jgi:hypothetical protein
MMFAKEEEEVGNDNICTLTGKFNINNSLIWILENNKGENKVIVDYTE